MIFLILEGQKNTQVERELDIEKAYVNKYRICVLIMAKFEKEKK